MKIKTLLLFICFSVCFPWEVQAGVDPARAALFLELKQRQERWYKAQAAAIAANVEGHTFVAKQVKGITKLNKEYDDFLTDVDSVLNYVGTSQVQHRTAIPSAGVA